MGRSNEDRAGPAQILQRQYHTIMIYPKAVETARELLAKSVEASMCMDDRELMGAFAKSIMHQESNTIVLLAHAIVERAARQTQTTEPTPNEPTTPRSFSA